MHLSDGAEAAPGESPGAPRPQVQALRALGHSQRLPGGERHQRRQHHAGGPPRRRGRPGARHTQPPAGGRRHGGTAVAGAVSRFSFCRVIRTEPNVCGSQIAGDMLCADQNFDVAQVIRFFRSEVIIRRGRGRESNR